MFPSLRQSLRGGSVADSQNPNSHISQPLASLWEHLEHLLASSDMLRDVQALRSAHHRALSLLQRFEDRAAIPMTGSFNVNSEQTVNLLSQSLPGNTLDNISLEIAQDVIWETLTVHPNELCELGKRTNMDSSALVDLQSKPESPNEHSLALSFGLPSLDTLALMSFDMSIDPFDESQLHQMTQLRENRDFTHSVQGFRKNGNGSSLSRWCSICLRGNQAGGPTTLNDERAPPKASSIFPLTLEHLELRHRCHKDQQLITERLQSLAAHAESAAQETASRVNQTNQRLSQNFARQLALVENIRQLEQLHRKLMAEYIQNITQRVDATMEELETRRSDNRLADHLEHRRQILAATAAHCKWAIHRDSNKAKQQKGTQRAGINIIENNGIE